MLRQTHWTKSKLAEVSLFLAVLLSYDRFRVESLAPLGQWKSLPQFCTIEQMPGSSLTDKETNRAVILEQLLIERPAVTASVQHEYPSTIGGTRNFRDHVQQLVILTDKIPGILGIKPVDQRKRPFPRKDVRIGIALSRSDQTLPRASAGQSKSPEPLDIHSSEAILLESASRPLQRAH